MTKNERDNLSGAYALDAVSDDERTEYDKLLEESLDARSEATELQDTSVMLGLAVDPVVPSDALRARLLAQIAVTPQYQREDAAPATPVLPAERRAQARWFQRPAVAIASVAAAIALIAGGISVTTNLGSEPTPPATASALEQLTLASDKQQLSGDVAGGGTATVIYSESLGTSAVLVSGESSLTTDEVYQLWYIGDDGARPAGFLPSDTTDDSWELLDGTFTAGEAIGVTVEPSGGSTTPSTTPVVVLQS